MFSKFRSNSILEGAVDYFCLSCEIHLKCDSDVDSHIVKPIHKKNLDKTAYVSSCAEDHVRKVSKGYFCEYCNTFLTTMTKVHLHISDETHGFNKSDCLGTSVTKNSFIKWSNNCIIAFNDLLISDLSWQGFTGNTCLVCDMEFTDVNIHKSDTGHILKIIQAKIQIGGDNSICRKIDDSTFQCLTCNQVLTSAALVTHPETKEHITKYLDCRKAKRAFDAKNAPKTVTEKEPKKNDAKTEEKQTKEQKSKQVKENKAKDTSKEEQYTTMASTGTRIDEVLGLEDHISLIDNHVVCVLCELEIDWNGIKAHTNSYHHKQLLKMQLKADGVEPKEKVKVNEKLEQTQDNVKETPKKEVEKKVATDPKLETNVKNAVSNEENVTSHDDKSKILDSIQILQKNEVLIDLISDKAYCKKCSIPLEYVYDSIMKHIDDHKANSTSVGQKYPEFVPQVDYNKNEVTTGAIPKKTEEKNAKTTETEAKISKEKKSKLTEEKRQKSVVEKQEVLPEDPKAFAKNNLMTYNPEFKKAYCRVCDTKVPSSLKSMKEHVNGAHHKAKATAKQPANVADMHIPPPQYNTVLFESYIKSIAIRKNPFFELAIVNEEFCIDYLSFMLVTRGYYNYRCIMCERSISENYMEKHMEIEENKHERAIKATLFVTSLDGEFVREVRPGLFHCGFCNQLESNWESLQEHLQSTVHKRVRAQCEWRLEESLPHIHEHIERKHMQFVLLMNMLARGWSSDI